MCQVNFEIQTKNNVKPILSGEGRYRHIDNQTWVDFGINIDDPITPDIIINGNYELEVRVSFSATPTELEWSAWKASTFKVSSDGCDDSYYKVYFNDENQGVGVHLLN